MPPRTDVSRLPGPWQPRFSMGTLLLAMLVAAVMAASTSYLARALREGDRQAQLVFLLITLAGPMLLLVIVSLIRWLMAGRR